jgi:hypothetical protein
MKGDKMLTKRDYNTIALILYNVWASSDDYEHLVDEIADNLADYFEKDNPNFNRERFLVSCGVK